jgi:aldehyde dehydrogenase (NAD+)
MSFYNEAPAIEVDSPDIQTQIIQKYKALREFHDSGRARSYAFRIEQLTALRKAIEEHAEEIKEALYKDFRKPGYETYLSDVGVITDELKLAIRMLKSWMKPKRVSTPLAIFPGYASRLYPESKGVVAIFAPWNYPVNLVFIPLIGAIAAGNTVMVKPAHETPHAAALVEKIIRKTFHPDHVTTILGEGQVVGSLMLDNVRFDHIFFTGSQQVGKFVMGKAAAKLTPVTLELGGKNPAIVDKSCHLQHSVNRLVWGKFFNAGQTCIAPDFLLIHEDVFAETIQLIKSRITELFGENPKNSPHFSRIVNTKRCEKLTGYLSQGEILYGGDYDVSDCYIAPTILRVKDFSLPVMNEEIFGPIWPVLTWKSKEELLPLIRHNRYPLACYMYTNRKELSDYIIQNVEFGSGCINDNMVQFANKSLPFGGVQYSGFGRYHGRTSFETFSNIKGVVRTFSWLDHGLKYAPYKKWQETIARFFLQ